MGLICAPWRTILHSLRPEWAPGVCCFAEQIGLAYPMDISRKHSLSKIRAKTNVQENRTRSSLSSSPRASGSRRGNKLRNVRLLFVLYALLSGSCSSSLSSTNLSRDKKDVSCHAIGLKLVNVRKRGWLYESFMVMTIVFCNIFLWLPCGSGQAGFLASGVLTFCFCCPGPIIHLNSQS